MGGIFGNRAEEEKKDDDYVAKMRDSFPWPIIGRCGSVRERVKMGMSCGVSPIKNLTVTMKKYL